MCCGTLKFVFTWGKQEYTFWYVFVYFHFLFCDISFASVQFSYSVVSDSLWPHRLQHTRLPCPSPAPGACSNSCPLSRWCHPTISSFVVPFSCLQSIPASGLFRWVSSLHQVAFASNTFIGASAPTSVLPMNIQDWYPLEWTGCISLQSKRLSRVFSSTTVQKY